MGRNTSMKIGPESIKKFNVFLFVCDFFVKNTFFDLENSI